MPIRAFVFDAYGTLYDVQSVLHRVERACPGKGELITQIWRLKQLEYTWLLTSMKVYAGFDVVTRDSLAYALGVAGVEPTDTLLSSLADAYLHLSPAPEAADALRSLRGRPCAIFSNGTPAMLDALVRNTGLHDQIDHVLSVDPARAYKPSPKAYALLEPALGLPPGEVLFVSSNGFDVAGAKRFGFQVAWVRRGGGSGPVPNDAGPSEMFKAQRLHAERLGIPAPDYTVHALTDLAALVYGASSTSSTASAMSTTSSSG